MKAILLAVIFLASSMNVAQEQKPENDACKFTVSQDSNVPSIAGPEKLTPLVYVVQQPDSPIEIVSVDLQGMWLSVSDNRYTSNHSAKYQVGNRTNQAVRFAQLLLGFNAGGGFGPINPRPVS